MIRIRQIKIDVVNTDENALVKAVAKKLKIGQGLVSRVSVVKKSIDARNKSNIFYVYEVDAEIEGEDKVLANVGNADIFPSPDMEYHHTEKGETPLNNSPIIVGSGPAGLFCAYILAEQGYNPVVIERGEDIDTRTATVLKFWEEGILNPDSNVQFGEGGAGAFSDGKLNTLVKDEGNRCRKVLSTFVSHGAPDNILYDSKPHIGTDLLVGIIRSMREKIISMGGKFMFNTCLTDIIAEGNKVKGIVVNNTHTIPCDLVVIAVGHSARDTFGMLYDKGVSMSAKPFAVGVRVQHSQDMINESQYGSKYKDILPPSSYKLTYKSTSGRGVYSFCMCPGGYVVNASSEEGRLAVNGMSYNDRGGDNANSAIIVTVTPEDFGTSPLDGVAFQRELECKAYLSGGGRIPVQLLGDFEEGKASESFGKVLPQMKGEYAFADINTILPEYVTSPIKEAFGYFGKRIRGFDAADSLLAAVESRTSSPVRIERDDNGESSLSGMYPCGEGAGYAGGITSAAMDGIRVAEKIISRYFLESNK